MIKMLSTPVSLNIRLRRSWHSYQCFFTWTIHPNTTPSWHSSLAVGSLQDSTEKKCSRYPPGQIPSMGCSRTNLGVPYLASWRTQRISPWRASLEGGILWVLQLCKIEPPQIGLCPAHPTAARSDQDLGDSEARSTPWARCHTPGVVP